MEQIRDCAQAFSEPTKWLAPSNAYAFIEVPKQRVVVVFTRDVPASSMVRVEGDVLHIDRTITNRLREPLDLRYWDLNVFVEDLEGTKFMAHVGRIDLDQPIDDPALLGSLRTEAEPT